MEVVFQILIALLASRGQSGAVTATNNSSLSVELYVSVPSAYLSPKHNYTSTFGAGEQAHSRVSATRSGVTTVAAVNTNRSGGGHSVPTPTDIADHTGNAASVTSESTTLPASVTSESVPGQATDSQTARGTTSAVTWIDETVTDVSENAGTVDTVPGSVHIKDDNDDIPSETVLTSLATTTTTTTHAGNVAATCPRQTNDCEAMLCEMEAGYFVINTAACSAKNRPKIDTTEPTTVEILVNEIDGRPNSLCYWRIIVPENHFVNVTVDQLVLHETDPNGTLTLQFSGFYESQGFTNLPFDIDVLRSSNVTLMFTSSVRVHFWSHGLSPGSSVTFHFRLQREIIFLPVVRLTNTLGYVTSPRYSDLDPWYLSSYDGEFHLEISDKQSVMISFVEFDLEEWWKRCNDYLDFNVTASNDSWRKCGTQTMPTRVYRSSIHLFFHTNYMRSRRGFKMMYAIFPRSQEPQQLSDNLFNCSVPHFHSFKPLVSCNMARECQEDEDEKDCGYYSDECGAGALDTGTKCYKFLRRSGSATWSEANSECIEDNKNLLTLPTHDEFRRFVQSMAHMKNKRLIFLGARLVDKLPHVNMDLMYKQLWRWGDGRTAMIKIIGLAATPACAFYSPETGFFESKKCHKSYEADIVCEFSKPNALSVNTTVVSLVSSVSIDFNDTAWKVSLLVQCPSGHVTRDFLSCDIQGQCGAKESMTSCHSGSVTVAMFVCERSRESLHYTLVCDHIQHCEDNTDEDFCQFSPCPVSWFRCRKGQCVPPYQVCNVKWDCYDGSDEGCKWHRIFLSVTTLPPAVLDMSSKARPFLKQMKDSEECPVTHFQCSQGYCLPIYLRCNGVDDCPNREDEASCESYTCSGFYRCRGSKVCLHADHVCDSYFQCPQYDDELLCEKMACPNVCQCQGLAFVCTANFSASSYPALRYLDASGSGLMYSDLTHNLFLIYLRLSDCRIDTQPTLELPRLRYLDLSGNELVHIDMHHFYSLKNLRVLVLSGNPLSAITNTESPEPGTMVLQTINLSGTLLRVYNGSALAGYPNLKTLNISGSVLTTITDEGFQSTPLLENLDVRESPLKDFPGELLRGLVSLKVVNADNYKLCCEAILPEDFDLNKCHAKQDLLASCKDLLKSNMYRVFLWLFASLSVVGNVGSFVARLYLGNRGAGLGSFSIFVTNLAMADFFMGVYLAIVVVADQIYHGEYLWHDDQWKESTVCKITGFLSLMSSEVSAFIICLITLDRFLALRFPLSSLHFSRRSALAACAIVWVAGIALAAVPLLPVTSHWEFYGQTGICIPLPFTTSERFHGYHYSFSVMIILNFVLFLLIAVGQAFICWSVCSSSISSLTKTGSRDATIARRLTTIVLSDFLCWFPIGLLGVLASTGTPIPDELNVAVAIFVMPFNSALNPFLYTFNVLMEKRRKAQEANLLKRLESRMCTEKNSALLKIPLPVNRSSAMQLTKKWLSEQVLSKDDCVVLCNQL